MDNALVMLHHKFQPLDPNTDIFVSNLVKIPKSVLHLYGFCIAIYGKIAMLKSVPLDLK